MTDNPERAIYLEDIPLQEALDTLFSLGRQTPLSSETVALSVALGRITAEPIWAKLSSPHYHASAMDGYAVRAIDTLDATETQPKQLIIDEQAFAVNTGDPLPPMTDAIIMIEHVEPLDNGNIQIRASVAPRQHVRLLGEDMVSTELVLPANHRIRPVDLGAIAGCGHHVVNVRRKPRVVIIPTGSELVPVDESPKVGQIIEYNSLMLGGQIVEMGGEATIKAIVPDSLDKIADALNASLTESPDLILVLSGSSAGSRDFTAQVLKQLGTLSVHGVAVRPGHPVIIGTINTIPIIGVPGYPVSAALTGEIFIQPLLAKWLGTRPLITERPHIQAYSTRKLVSPIGDDDFVRVALAQVGDRLLATPLSRGAGVITSMVRADGLAHIPRFNEGVNAGQALDVMLYQSLQSIQHTILAIGSHDPMLDMLGQFITMKFPEVRFTSANVGSMGGLVALKRQEAHVAGIHLLDRKMGDYNHSFVAKYLPDTPIHLVTFAHREQGILVSRGNPKKILSLDDLTRVSFVNRQRGSGTRLLLDYELDQRNIKSEKIVGYGYEEFTHLAVAAAIESGIADCGLGVRRAAIAMNLDFIPIGWERYDLAIPEEYVDHVAPLLAVLNDNEFKTMLADQPGYDVSQMGTTPSI